MNRAETLGPLLLTAGQLLQSRIHHGRDRERTEALHREAIELTRKQHSRDILMLKQTYLLDVYVNLDQHFQQLNADLISSSKESERDMFDQRNQQYQTIILSCSVMYGALSTVIIQGYLPVRSGNFLFVTYALTCALSFALLFLCIVLCIEIITRASHFMYERASYQAKELMTAIESSKEMMMNIRRDSTGGRRIFMLDPKEIDVEWDRHEKLIHDFLKKREATHRKAALVSVENQNSHPGKKSFNDFWEHSCQRLSEWAIIFFYSGTVNLLLAIMIFMWAEFYINYVNTSGAVIAVCLIGLGLVVGLVFLTYLRLHRPYLSVMSPVHRDGFHSRHFAESAIDIDVASASSLDETSSSRLFSVPTNTAGATAAGYGHSSDHAFVL